MKSKKKFIISTILLLIIIFILMYYKEIPHYFVKTFLYHNYATEELEKNNYAKEQDYNFVQITDDFVAKDKQHLLNIFYTILDSGNTSFYFYCDDNYLECKNDVDKLIPSTNEEESALADINNFVHPFNSYKSINIISNSFGKITVTVEKQYTEEEILKINNELQNIINKNISENMKLNDKIKAFHDYIINNTSYDIDRANNMTSSEYQTSSTHTAYGLLVDKKALCGGYSDIMSIFLYQLEIPNFRVSADNHVWNLVYLNDTWLHLDATWDDPVTNTGEQLLIYDYFLIPYKKLLETDPVEHKFNLEIYSEAK